MRANPPQVERSNPKGAAPGNSEGGGVEVAGVADRVAGSNRVSPNRRMPGSSGPADRIAGLAVTRRRRSGSSRIGSRTLAPVATSRMGVAASR